MKQTMYCMHAATDFCNRTSTFRATRHHKRHPIALWLAPTLLSKFDAHIMPNDA